MSSVLDPFIAHGFEETGRTATQVIGTCPFCGKPNKFYVSEVSGLFDCKVCGVQGNQYKFLSLLADQIREQTTGRQYHDLALIRSGIPGKSLRKFRLGWQPEFGRWVIPVQNSRGTVTDLRYWYPPIPGEKRRGVRSTQGCSVGLLGAYALAKAPRGSVVWVCEGEWDAMAWWHQGSTDGEYTVGVPGAGTFKDAWLDLFRGMDVRLLYDHDAPDKNGRIAGADGAKRAATMLYRVAGRVQVLGWMEDDTLGQDVRDVVGRLGGPGAREYVEERLTEFLPEDATARKPEAVEKTLVSDFTEVLVVYRKWLSMTVEMVDALKVAFAVVFASALTGDPVWLYLVGPPGCGKTVLLMSMQGSDRCCFTSTMSPHSLVSGFRSERDPSLLPKWNGKCSVLKDFTEVLAKHPQAKEDIYGTLRGAFDGHVVHTFGNGTTREYWVRFSMIAGVTPAIHGDRMAMMGERFLKYEMMRGNDWSADAQVTQAISNLIRPEDMQKDLQAVAGGFLSREVPSPLPDIPERYVDRMVALSQLIAALRANVDRPEFQSDGPLRYRPTREVGTRLATQLLRLGQMLCVVDGEPSLGEEQWRVLVKTAKDTAIGFHLDLVEALITGPKQRKDLSQALTLPESSLGRVLEDLLILGVVGKSMNDSPQQAGRPAYLWGLRDWVRDLWVRAFTKEGETENGKVHLVGKVRVRTAASRSLSPDHVAGVPCTPKAPTVRRGRDRRM